MSSCDVGFAKVCDILRNGPLTRLSCRQVILSKIGSPSADDKAFITNKKARDHVASLGKFKKQPWSALLPAATAASLDLLEQILQFDPKKRLRAADCLTHPWLEEHHDPTDEIEHPCPSTFTFDSDFSFEDEKQVNWRCAAPRASATPRAPRVPPIAPAAPKPDLFAFGRSEMWAEVLKRRQIE